MVNTSVLIEVYICSVRQDLTRSCFIVSVIINEREANTLVAYLLWGYVKRDFCFKISYPLYRLLPPTTDNSNMCYLNCITRCEARNRKCLIYNRSVSLTGGRKPEASSRESLLPSVLSSSHTEDSTSPEESFPFFSSPRSMSITCTTPGFRIRSSVSTWLRLSSTSM